MQQEKGNNRQDHVDEDVKVKLGLDDEQIKNFYGKNNSADVKPTECTRTLTKSTEPSS